MAELGQRNDGGNHWIDFHADSFRYARVRVAEDRWISKSFSLAFDLERFGVRVPAAVLCDLLHVLGSERSQFSILTLPAVAARGSHGTAAVEPWSLHLQAMVNSDMPANVRETMGQGNLWTALFLKLVDQANFDLPHIPLPALIDVEDAARRAKIFLSAAPTPHQSANQYDPPSFARFLPAFGFRVLLRIEILDPDTLRLLAMLPPDEAPDSLIDTVSVMRDPDSNDVVNFTMELLPKLLETKGRTKTARASFDGYVGVDRKGTLDSLAASEFAYDNEMMELRFLENELLYYLREQKSEEENSLHLVLIDASTSMRGERSVFARGLALALAERVKREGDACIVRYFDSNLYEVLDMSPTDRAGATRGHRATNVLAFKGERGRDYERALEQLTQYLRTQRSRTKDQLFVHLFTHGECHFSAEAMADLSRLCRVSLILVLPTQAIESLTYLPWVHDYRVITHDILRQSKQREAMALSIVESAVVKRSAKDESQSNANEATREEEEMRKRDLLDAESEIANFLREDAT